MTLRRKYRGPTTRDQTVRTRILTQALPILTSSDRILATRFGRGGVRYRFLSHETGIASSILYPSSRDIWGWACGWAAGIRLGLPHVYLPV
jgi:hypothetical protein